ncbi:hypothetical protein O181_022120 [Austropuccinia psidii MF-1]|uniref:Uncharacterized protein n=1 Tax=Austropuccinia psidii MF-1 TaxID=1389203 RepID=A0A9Q3CFW1_9BASI|nr:hypothetical protein [Austropuccinia psidii MF-1]
MFISQVNNKYTILLSRILTDSTLLKSPFCSLVSCNQGNFFLAKGRASCQKVATTIDPIDLMACDWKSPTGYYSADCGRRFLNQDTSLENSAS